MYTELLKNASMVVKKIVEEKADEETPKEDNEKPVEDTPKDDENPDSVVEADETPKE